MDKNNERELLPDILKGFAIILVVLGHCIQEGSGETYRTEVLYFSDRLYQFIYSFHMPLFMMVSGYLSWSSMKKAQSNKERRALLRKRISVLVVPIFLWSAVDYARILITNHMNGEPQPEALIFVYFYNVLNNLWFLWAVWWCFLIVYIMHYFLKDNIIIYGLGFMVLFVIPDGLGLGAYKYMMPYFISAYYMHGYIQDKGQEFKKTPKLWMLAATGLAFAGLFIFYNEDSFIYLTGYKLIGKNMAKQLWIDLYRMLVGFVGSGFFIFAWQYIISGINRINKVSKLNFEFKILRKLGAETMGIYILSGYLLALIMPQLDIIKGPSYLLNLLETVVVIIMSLIIIAIMKKIPLLKVFIGK